MRNDNISSQILRDLQEIKVELRGTRGMRGEMEARFDALDLRIEGLSHLLTLLAGQSRRCEDRLARIEEECFLQDRDDGDRTSERVRDGIVKMLLQKESD